MHILFFVSIHIIYIYQHNIYDDREGSDVHVKRYCAGHFSWINWKQAGLSVHRAKPPTGIFV